MKPYVRKGLTAEFDSTHYTVVLYFGESKVTEWPVTHADMTQDDLRVKWRLDRFVAKKLGEALSRLEDDDE